MTASEIIYRIKNVIRGGLNSQSEPISDRLIMNMVNSFRSKLIRQEIARANFLSGYLVQNLGKVELIKHDKNECSDDIINDCALRTKYKIPKTIDTNNIDLLTFVGNLDGLPYQRASHNTVNYLSYSKYTGKRPKFYEIDEYIYIVNPPTRILKYINIQGVFEDPQRAKSFNDCGNIDDCYQGFDYEYPVSASIIDMLINLVIQELKSGITKPMDTINNSKDDVL